MAGSKATLRQDMEEQRLPQADAVCTPARDVGGKRGPRFTLRGIRDKIQGGVTRKSLENQAIRAC